ncbi:hypothetical protein Tco_0329143 [Tanacetum coccineum]
MWHLLRASGLMLIELTLMILLQTTRRPRHDDPYVMVGDAATRNKGDDAATTSDPQPLQPPGSPHYHLYTCSNLATKETTNGVDEPAYYQGNAGGAQANVREKQGKVCCGYTSGSSPDMVELSGPPTLGLEVVNAKSGMI